MDNSQPSFGPGSAVLGGASNVTQAMPQAGGSNVMTQQVSPASAIYNPGIQVPSPTQMPQTGNSMGAMGQFAFQGAMNPSQMPQQAPQAPQQASTAAQPPKAESHMIIEALTKRLHDLTKLEHSIHGVQ